MAEVGEEDMITRRFTDGTVHNMNEYMGTRAMDLIVNLDDRVVNAVYSEKFDMVMGENQLLELFSQLP
ncbi:hypothetical protein MLD38_007575 [Melastoma candidum]|uniref:Uncharacterized protein n=1 Tax=Melastoma candidum TaxID=119954 RepID=A0ACB9RRI4_9MYRT|nr:hypothetical protein MLD38_007575 [Melastoma candidum]